MKSFYKYHSFGLTILSEIEIPELPFGNFTYNEVQVVIRFGKTPKTITHCRDYGVLFQAKENELLFKISSVASYFIENGERITIERYRNSTEEEIRLFLLGSAFGALLHQKGLLPFHGSAIVKDNEATIIAGPSGSGKSSLAATLINRGYEVLSDDISVVFMKNNVPYVNQGIPHLKLWEDVIVALGYSKSNYKKIRPQLNKYRKPIEALIDSNSFRLNKIVVLGVKNTPGFNFDTIKGVQKFEFLKKNTYRFRYVNGLDRQNFHFNLLSELITRIEVTQLERPNSPLLLQEMADYFEAQMD